jgi:hypothetical protein
MAKRTKKKPQRRLLPFSLAGLAIIFFLLGMVQKTGTAAWVITGMLCMFFIGAAMATYFSELHHRT